MLGKKVNILLLTLLTLLSTATFAAVHTQYSSTVCSNTPYLFGCDKLTTSGAYSQTLVDSTVTVNLLFGALKATAYTATIEPGQTYLFGCQKLTADATETNTLQQTGCECDSTVTLTLTVQAPAPTPTSVTVAYTANIYDGETYLFGCQKLTAAGPYTETFQRVGGGDSIVNLTLNVNPVPSQDVTVAYTANIYDGETYLFGCQKLTAAGPYTETFQRVGGGDSIVNLTLNVNPVPVQKITVEYNTEIEVGQTYLFGCKTYTYTETGPQTLKDSVQAVNGGDSIIIVHLTVSAGGGGQMDTVVGYTSTIYTGETYLFGCQKLKTAGVYTDTLQRVNVIGDSVTVLTLDVIDPTVTVEYEATIKQGQTYLFGCQKLTAAGPYTETFQRVGGGDSIVNLTLNVLATTYCDTTITTCDSLVWIHETIKTSGEYIDTIPNVAGGDSIITLHLTVNYATTGSETVSACGDYLWHGKVYDLSGIYVDTLSSLVTGCDSIVTLNLTINQPVYGPTQTVTGCDSVIYKGIKYTASTQIEDTLDIPAANLCDSILLVNIIVNQHAEGDSTIVGCDAVVFKGITYTADTLVYDTIAGGAASGCDSIVAVTITVKHHAEGDSTIVGCDAVVFKSITYTADAVVYDTLTAASGCDSIVAVTITVKHSTASEEYAENCDSYVWRGNTYTASGDYTDTIPNIAGCDSILTLHLTIHHADSSSVEVVDTCNMYTWHDSLYTRSGVYYDTLQTAAGCDSVCKLDLTIVLPYQDTLTIEHYYGDRIIMINRHEINALGWKLDSLDLDHPEFVKWYRIEASGDTTYLDGCDGYYYTMPNGDPISAGTYFAVITIEPGEGARCGAQGRTETYTVTGAAPAPALLPSLARPGEDIRIINLNPMVKTDVRIYSADGLVQGSYTVSGEETYTIKAAGTTGFYLVELYNEGMKSTLRYIVK